MHTKQLKDILPSSAVKHAKKINIFFFSFHLYFDIYSMIQKVNNIQKYFQIACGNNNNHRRFIKGRKRLMCVENYW